MEQRNTKRSYRLFVGVDIASRDFTAASVVPRAKPTRESHPYEQTAHGFERFQQRLQESGLPPMDILVVMEATGSYWVALATVLYQAGFAVSVINPAQAHYFAKAQLKRTHRRLPNWLKHSFQPVGHHRLGSTMNCNSA